MNQYAQLLVIGRLFSRWAVATARWPSPSSSPIPRSYGGWSQIDVGGSPTLDRLQSK